MATDDETWSATGRALRTGDDPTLPGPRRDATEPAYEVRPVVIGRSARTRPAVVAVAAAVLVGIVVLKPWTWGGDPRSPAAAVAPAPAATPPPAAAALRAATDAPVAIPTPGWPVVAKAGAPLAQPIRTPMALWALTMRAGTWGVGDASLGPQTEREEPWADWVPVQPEAATDTPIHIAIWPGTGICAGVPRLLDRPLFFAITSAPDLPADRRLVAWWTDGGRAASLDGSVQQITPVGERGISYLVRNDDAAWPAGRYEFHVEGGGRAYALTICIPADG